MSKIKVSVLLALLALVFFVPAKAQLQNEDVYELPELKQGTGLNYRFNINLPDLDGYKTLRCDFHTHSVFSDGRVWPTMRVIEAWLDGLDAVAITDHIEYLRYKDIFVADFNKSSELAEKKGKAIGMMVIRGAEITRNKPLGHLNALFLNDASKLKVDNELEAIEEAVKQGAYIQWNHPGWPNDTSAMYPVHKQLIAENKIHGIEVFNSSEFYPKVLDWCDEYGLAYFANTDLHYASASVYREKMARPMTLVFAKEESLEGIKEALIDGRTLAYFDHHLAGKEALLKEFVKKSIAVKVVNADKGIIELSNNSDINYDIQFGKYMYPLTLKAHYTLRVKMPSATDVTFVNCMIRQNKKLVMQLW